MLFLLIVSSYNVNPLCMNHLYEVHPVAYFANYSIMFLCRLTQHMECVTLKLIYLLTITTCFDHYFSHHQVNNIIYQMLF
jgi:hypothetical protein